MDFSSSFASETDTGPCNLTFITPACLQWLYDIPSTPAMNAENQLVVTGYELEWPQEADLRVSIHFLELAKFSW